MMRNDPDLKESLIGLEQVYSEYAHARGQAKALSPVTSYMAHHAAKQMEADRLSIIITRANKLLWEPDALGLLLAIQARLKRKMKRRPSPVQMTAAIQHECGEAEKKFNEDKAALSKAQARFDASDRALKAARAARLLYTGCSA